MAQQVQGIDDLQGVSSTVTAFVHAVRMFLRDHRQLNVIIDGVEHSDQLIVQAICLMLSDFASAGPPLGWFDLDTLINRYFMYSLCMRGVCAFLLESVLALAVRNEVPFADGKLAVQFQHMLPTMSAQAQRFRQEWEVKALRQKVRMNVASAQGMASPGSEYSLLAGWSNSGVSHTGS